jgi:hypothetical protein
MAFVIRLDKNFKGVYVMANQEYSAMHHEKRAELLAKFKQADEAARQQHTDVKLSRAERRRAERSRKKFDQLQTFSKKQVEDMNAQAYKYGVAMALLAAKNVLQLGETRLDRVRMKIKEYEFEYFEQFKPFTPEMETIGEFKGAVRRGKEKQ